MNISLLLVLGIISLVNNSNTLPDNNLTAFVNPPPITQPVAPSVVTWDQVQAILPEYKELYEGLPEPKYLYVRKDMPAFLKLTTIGNKPPTPIPRS